MVIAAGAWSKPLAAGLGDDVPLETERGYNVSFPRVTSILTRPVAFQGHGFVATPLDTGLRIGGAVELAGLKLPPNHERSRALHTKAQRFLRGLPAYETGTQWMGFRPSIPDSPAGHRALARREHRWSMPSATGITGSRNRRRRGGSSPISSRAASPPIDLARFSPQRF